MEIFKILAQMVDCFASHYTDKSSINEVATQAGIDKLELDLEGSPRDKWFNIIQYLSYNDPSVISALLTCAMEANTESSCLTQTAEMIGFQQPKTSPTPTESTRGGGLMDVIEDILESGTAGSTALPNILGQFLNKKPSTTATPSSKPKASSSPKVFPEPSSYHIMLQSLAVGLVRNQGAGVCTGFLISERTVLLTSLAIQKKEELSQLTIEFKNPLLKKNVVYSFSKILEWSPEHYILIAELDKPISSIKPLIIADLDYSIDEEGALISYSNLNKSITTVTDIQNHDANLKYTTYSSGGSAGGPVIIGNKVVAMHHSGSIRTKEKIGLATDLRRLKFLDKYKSE